MEIVDYLPLQVSPQRNLLSLKSLGISLWLQIALKKYILGACYLEIDREKEKCIGPWCNWSYVAKMLLEFERKLLF